MNRSIHVLVLTAALSTAVTALAAERNRFNAKPASTTNGSKVVKPAFKVKPQVVKPIDPPKFKVPQVVKPNNPPQFKVPQVIKPIDPPQFKVPQVIKPNNPPQFKVPQVIKPIDPPMVDKKVGLPGNFEPQIVAPKGKLAGLPGLKLPGNAKFNPAELAKLKPALDAKKLKPGDLGKLKPPADFKVKPIDLGKLNLPANAPAVGKLNAGLKFNDKFVLNQNFYKGNDYHLKFGTKMGTSFCYQGIHHNHWHHCQWDPWYQCNYYYCPSTCCYYYWSPSACCYYPCWWFVDHGGCNYPWWLCGNYGTQMFGNGFSIHIGF